jgi:hypothetical protein
MRKVREGGTLVWGRESAKAVPRSDGSLIALIACEDVSDRKRGEQRIAAPRQVRVLSARSARRWMGTWARFGPLGSGGSYVATVSAPIQRGLRRIRLVSRERSLTPGQGRVRQVWQNRQSLLIADITKEAGDCPHECINCLSSRGSDRSRHRRAYIGTCVLVCSKDPGTPAVACIREKSPARPL